MSQTCDMSFSFAARLFLTVLWEEFVRACHLFLPKTLVVVFWQLVRTVGNFAMPDTTGYIISQP